QGRDSGSFRAASKLKITLEPSARGCRCERGFELCELRAENAKQGADVVGMCAPGFLAADPSNPGAGAFDEVQGFARLVVGQSGCRHAKLDERALRSYCF